MPSLLLNTIALDPNRWTPAKQPYTHLETVLDRVVASGFRQLEIWQSGRSGWERQRWMSTATRWW